MEIISILLKGKMSHSIFLQKLIDDRGMFVPDELICKSADAMLKELEQWSEALKVLRKK